VTFQSPEYEVTAQVERVMLAEGICMEELLSMLDQAAITSHARGNRRYHHWVLQVEGALIKRMTYFEDATRTVRSPSHPTPFTVWEDHEACDGQGCMACGHTGKITTTYKQTVRAILGLRK
jgi:hypothetical protein